MSFPTEPIFSDIYTKFDKYHIRLVLYALMLSKIIIIYFVIDHPEMIKLTNFDEFLTNISLPFSIFVKSHQFHFKSLCIIFDRGSSRMAKSACTIPLLEILRY